MGPDSSQSVRVVTDVPIPKLFDFLTLPSNHVRFDGSGQLVSATLQQITAVGEVFTVIVSDLRHGEREIENHVVEFTADLQLAWMPAVPGQPPYGMRWDWTFDVGAHGETIVSQTCDWTELGADWPPGAVPPPSVDQMRLSTRRLIELVSSTIRLT